MTHDELRDELARAMGWTYYPDAISHINSTTMQDVRGVWAKGNPHESDNRNPSRHPVERTADAALAAWDRLCGKYWQPWTRECDGDTFWYATLQKNWDGEEYPTVKDTGNFAHDLCALTLAAARAKGGEADGK